MTATALQTDPKREDVAAVAGHVERRVRRAVEVSLRPYNGRLFVAHTVDEYKAAHRRVFAADDELTCATEGRFAGGEGKDGVWTYLVWAEKPHTMAHELAHVVLHVFERCGIDPRSGNGEPFCYMLSQVMLDAQRA